MPRWTISETATKEIKGFPCTRTVCPRLTDVSPYATLWKPQIFQNGQNRVSSGGRSLGEV